MNPDLDRLYDLLPVIHRQRDAEQGYPLRALLQVIAEQVGVVSDDIAGLYENWFIETCQDWVVPYIGELAGYEPVHAAGQPGGREQAARNRILIPRREVANTIRYRRRKGTLALLEELAAAVAGWPARAVEFYRLLSLAQPVNHLNIQAGRTADLRAGDALARLNGAFDESAHVVDVRELDSPYPPGYYNLLAVGLFVWRLRVYPVTITPAYNLDYKPNCFTFSVLGNDAPLYTKAAPQEDPHQIAGELNLPVSIRRGAFAAASGDYYGVGKSLHIWRQNTRNTPRQPVALDDLVVADLSEWKYQPERGKVAVDPVLGRIVFPPRQAPREGVWVSYHYGFSADIGGGEYDRPLSQHPQAVVWRVGENEELQRLNQALDRWLESRPENAVIEITDSGVYAEQVNINLQEGQSLQLRAAANRRPVIRLLDWQTSRPDALYISGAEGSRFTLDGLLVTGRGVQVEGDLVSLTIRHSTLVPGWSLESNCEPRRPAEPSLELYNTPACVIIERSILGTIFVSQDEVQTDPIPIRIYDSILDSTAPAREALSTPDGRLAHAVVTIARSTVFGLVLTHAIELAENAIFIGQVKAGRRQVGCVRFSYLSPGSRTPRRYHCQPDLVEAPILASYAAGELSQAERDRALARERRRVLPRFNSVRYGVPIYAQLAGACAEEIKRGADDESELGAFHHLYQPQREANLRARLVEYVPAGKDAGIIFAS